MVIILQMRKRRSREVKSLAPGHIASWWQDQASNPGGLASAPNPKPHCLLKRTTLPPGCLVPHTEKHPAQSLSGWFTEHGDRRLCSENACEVSSFISSGIVCTTVPSNFLPLPGKTLPLTMWPRGPPGRGLYSLPQHQCLAWTCDLL